MTENSSHKFIFFLIDAGEYVNVINICRTKKTVLTKFEIQMTIRKMYNMILVIISYHATNIHILLYGNRTKSAEKPNRF